ncbi:MAG: DUF3341 domain-containing protein [Deltaproteobacteria bacterium]|nr:DUF3341 domain-containing protein [Deltaproteobacteria bacterium]
MADGQGVLGIFEYVDDLVKVIKGMDLERRKKIIVYAPTIPHELEEALAEKPSPVRYLAFFGALIGCISGLALAAYTHLKWGIIVGGKPLISPAPIALIMFELTILFGGLGNFLGLLIFSRIPRLKVPDHYDTRFSGAAFGIFIRCDNGRFQEAEQCLKDAGAAEIIIR